MNAKPFFVVLTFILFLALMAGGAIGNTNLTSGPGAGDLNYDAFNGAAPPGPPGGVPNSLCGRVYTVRSGDTLSRIARSCGIALADLLAINPAISNPNLIRAGQLINIYVPSSNTPVPPTQPPQPTPTSSLRPDGLVPVHLSGFPANTIVLVSIGKTGTEPAIVDDGLTDEKGEFKLSVRIPKIANPDEKWVVTVSTLGYPNIEVRSPEFTIEK